jgi:hypothetical protein
LRAALLGQRCEILLTSLERIHFRSGRASRVHRERIRPDDDDPGGDILRDLGMILLGELFGLLVVRLDLGADRGAVAGRIRMRVASGAGG